MNPTLVPAMPTFQSASAVASAPIAPDLLEVELILNRTFEGYKGRASDLIEHLSHYRGKRLRPILLLLTAQACGGIRPAHHTLAAVVEMIHTATLVHDDVLDEADTRRHVRTINDKWGNKGAILLGDLLFTHAFHLSSTVGDARACQIIGDATNRVCAGELMQICERGNMSLNEEEYYQIIEGKTAALTECACRLGAMYAGADATVIDAMAEYGRSLGIAFQIADDLLDLLGEEKTTGKTLGTDLEQQKLTLPLIHMLDHVPSERAEELRHILSNGHADKRSLIRPVLEETRSLGYARRKAEELATMARTALQMLPPSATRAILEQLTEWTTRREG